LKEQEEVMGSGKLEANGTVGLYCTREMPWQASLHQLYLHPRRHFLCKTRSIGWGSARPQADGGQRGRVGTQSGYLVGQRHAADDVGGAVSGREGGVANGPGAVTGTPAKVCDLTTGEHPNEAGERSESRMGGRCWHTL
jgi:hypothetical protein